MKEVWRGQGSDKSQYMDAHITEAKTHLPSEFTDKDWSHFRIKLPESHTISKFTHNCLNVKSICKSHKKNDSTTQTNYYDQEQYERPYPTFNKIKTKQEDEKKAGIYKSINRSNGVKQHGIWLSAIST